jgi:hypothetical protein
MTVTPLDRIRRSAELDDLKTADDTLDRTDPEAVKRHLEKLKQILFRLKNDLP